MSPIALHSSTLHVVRPVTSRGPFPKFAPGEGVQFYVSGGMVRASVLGIDAKARSDLPLGLPYRLTVVQGPPFSGYDAGSECTIRAGCLERDASAPAPTPVPPAAASAPSPVAMATFLVAFLREGGQVPVQGAMLVQGPSLEAASAAALQQLNDELAADIAERGESPEAMVLLLNASEVPAFGASSPSPDAPVLATVSW